MTDGSKSNRRAKSFGGKSRWNLTGIDAKTSTSPPANGRSANRISFAAYFLCAAQQISESQILDAGASQGRFAGHFFKSLQLLHFSF
ncbi:MAG: hypothetical protein ABJA75_06770 [Bradyrhizobium sp.]